MGRIHSDSDTRNCIARIGLRLFRHLICDVRSWCVAFRFGARLPSAVTVLMLVGWVGVGQRLVGAVCVSGDSVCWAFLLCRARDATLVGFVQAARLAGAARSATDCPALECSLKVGGELSCGSGEWWRSTV